MNTRDLTRLVVFGFFVGLNIILGTYFVATVVGTGKLPDPLDNYLHRLSEVTGIKFDLDQEMNLLPIDPQPDEVQVNLTNIAIVELANQIRTQADLLPLTESAALSQAAATIAAALQTDGFAEKTDQELDEQLSAALTNEGYAYDTVLQSAVSGPVNLVELEQHWFINQVNDLLKTSDISEIGVSTQVIEKDGEFTGMTVILLAKPRANAQTMTSQSAQAKATSMPALPFISDEEVFTALNQYRSDHKVHQLVINQQLCTYAEKRVQDLIAFGGLDNHQGFKDDFADLNNLPDPIKDYPGGKIGENLAHQFCRNMTTGDSFIAETGTALIEWCFDSSTKGHREAQLDVGYNNVCVRHGNGMYVVIFGQ